jgi:hypothetical protein
MTTVGQHLNKLGGVDKVEFKSWIIDCSRHSLRKVFLRVLDNIFVNLTPHNPCDLRRHKPPSIRDEPLHALFEEMDSMIGGESDVKSNVSTAQR